MAGIEHLSDAALLVPLWLGVSLLAIYWLEH